ncbi:hypothetical protein [Ralstonia sp. UBA689]|uniref:hypothetical protein n=1 Tax=Ralstonia sp. UBA689 TaxID=1947373 RepID=UPI0025D46FB2|nr:hypothetical protein [Ralstonia sp. UBA689]
MHRIAVSLPRYCLAALVLLAGQTAVAAESGTAVTPEIHFENDIAYVSGGIGRDERDAMHAIASRFNVRLNVVSAKNGEALSDAEAAVVDGSGKLRLTVHMAGPLLYMKLPHGRYQVTVKYRGAMQTLNLQAGAQPVDVIVHLPSEPGPEEWLLCKRGCAQDSLRRPAGR